MVFWKFVIILSNSYYSHKPLIKWIFWVLPGINLETHMRKSQKKGTMKIEEG